MPCDEEEVRTSAMWSHIPKTELRRWIVENYPFSEAAADKFIKWDPVWATTLAHLLPRTSLQRLLQDRELGLSVLTKHPELFTPDQILQFAQRQRIKPFQLPLPVRRMLGLPPFTDYVYAAFADMAKDRRFARVLNAEWYNVCKYRVMFANTRMLQRDWHNFAAPYDSAQLIWDSLQYPVGAVCNSVLDIGPSIPRIDYGIADTLACWFGNEDSMSDLKCRRLVFIVGRLPPPAYDRFMRIVITGRMLLAVPRIKSPPDRLRWLLMHEMSGLRLSRTLLSEFIVDYPRLAVALHKQHYLRLSKKSAHMANQLAELAEQM